MAKQDLRKKIRVCIETTDKEMNNFELHMMCMPLCSKHSKAHLYDKHFRARPERELMTMHYECKDCDKVWSNWFKAMERVFWKLSHEYYKRFDEKQKPKPVKKTG